MANDTGAAPRGADDADGVLMLKPSRTLVTGATGFVGGFLCRRLLADGCAVRGTQLASENPAALVHGVAPALVEPLGAAVRWDEALAGVATVVHLAARVHVMEERCADPLEEFRKVNVTGTLTLARAAASAGVARFVFVSTVKVNGEESSLPYTRESLPNPTDPYGISKREAEDGLRLIAAETGMELVIVRPTLVYGPGVKANFLNLLKLVQRGLPLPLASLRNRRSMIFVGNLADALALCAVHPSAAGKTYLVSDGEEVSTPELIRRCAKALGVAARLFPFPLSLMMLAGRLSGRGAALSRLTGSLTVDCSPLREELGWRPPFTMDEGLRETSGWLKQQ